MLRALTSFLALIWRTLRRLFSSSTLARSKQARSGVVFGAIVNLIIAILLFFSLGSTKSFAWIFWVPTVVIMIIAAFAVDDLPGSLRLGSAPLWANALTWLVIPYNLLLTSITGGPSTSPYFIVYVAAVTCIIGFGTYRPRKIIIAAAGFSIPLTIHLAKWHCDLAADAGNGRSDLMVCAGVGSIVASAISASVATDFH